MKSFIVAAIIALPFVSSAHMGNISPERYEQMQKVMGADNVEIWQEMESQMMGVENREKMEQFMEKMLSGQLSVEDQKAMVALMKDSATSSGATMTMMRMMVPDMMKSSSVPGNRMMSGWNGSAYWITSVLIWTLLALAIAAIWKYLKGSAA